MINVTPEQRIALLSLIINRIGYLTGLDNPAKWAQEEKEMLESILKAIL